MQELENPYAAPKAVLQDPKGRNSDVEVSGKFIVVGRDADLPKRCFVTGELITTEKRQCKTLYYVNPYLALLILLGGIGIIVYVIISVSNRKKVFVRYSLSKGAKKKLRTKRLYGSIICAALFGLSLVAFSQGSEEMIGYGIFGIALFIIALIVTISIGTVMRVRKYKNGLFYLSGSGQKFRDYLMRHQPSSTINSQVRY